MGKNSANIFSPNVFLLTYQQLIEDTYSSFASSPLPETSMSSQPRVKYHESRKPLLRAINEFQQEGKPEGL